MDKDYWWGKAKEAAAAVGWFPTVIFAQWMWETTYKGIPFNSPNLINNNNIAGQTWLPYMPKSMQGSARPPAEGGFYMHYTDAAQGWIDFVLENGRYAHVKDVSTEEGQIEAIAAAGWAADPHYAEGLIRVLHENQAEGYTIEQQQQQQGVEIDMRKEDVDFILAVMGKYWMDMEGNAEVQAETHRVADELRKATGQNVDQ